ncbi:MAG: hypothetical protein A3E01_02960 [Gammaproteobacteria bacterium RIFCSPHIGHO2_12_FULL_63_22]|nr:MAG: hypothetical protein A3E01_02960 [Gammaproteobacteria bacterium RIFCSPHIGHO2_12_FULL_63_22]
MSAYRDHFRPEERRVVADLEKDLARLKGEIDAVRARRNRIVNRAILRARDAARKARNVSRVTNTDHVWSDGL